MLRTRLEYGKRVLPALSNLRTRFVHGGSLQVENEVTKSTNNIYKQRQISKRPLDGLESVFHEYHKTGIGFSYLLTPIRSKVPIEVQPLYKALTMVSYQQPLLRASITKTPKLKYFKCKEGRTSFGFSILDRDINDAEAITENIFATTKFESDDGPLWKAVLIPGRFDSSSNSYYGGLVLAISHAIANGPSLTVVLKQTLGHLENITKGSAPSLDDIPSLPLYPSSANLLSHKLDKLSVPSNIPPPTDYINPVLSQFPTIEDSPQRPEPKTKVIIRTIPSNQAASLVQKCRENKSTVTGAILAACHLSFSALLKPVQFPASATNDISCLVAVAENHHPKLPSDYVACHYSSLTYDIPLPSADTDFWEVAQSSTQCIRDDVSRDKHFEFLSKIEADSKGFIKQVLDQGCLKLASRQRSSLTVSNVGQFFAENSSQNLFHPQRLIVGVPIHTRIGTFGNYIMSLNDAIHYMFCYDASIISPEIAQRYADGVWDALDISGEPVTYRQ